MIDLIWFDGDQMIYAGTFDEHCRWHAYRREWDRMLYGSLSRVDEYGNHVCWL